MIFFETTLDCLYLDFIVLNNWTNCDHLEGLLESDLLRLVVIEFDFGEVAGLELVDQFE